MTFLQQRFDALLHVTCEGCGDTHTGNDLSARRWKRDHNCTAKPLPANLDLIPPETPMTSREQQDTRYWLTDKAYAALGETPPPGLTDADQKPEPEPATR